MTSFSKLSVTVAAALAIGLLTTAGPALADPPAGTTPRAADAVGVGGDAPQFLLDQLSHDYNAAHAGAPSLLYSWDQVNPSTGTAFDQIVTKATCAPIARPDGSVDGLAVLEDNTRDPSDSNDYCVDYVPSPRGRNSSDPMCASGGICFVALAGEAVTYATRNAASGGTNAPASLTLTQLLKIYVCTYTNWDQVGGPDAPIHPFLPQTGSGTRAVFLLALGGGTIPATPGTCVSTLNNTLQGNQGFDPALNDPNAIVPYSVADYIAQVYHSAPCVKFSCTGAPPCAPAGQENLYGCNQSGVLGLNEINGTAPATPWPLPAPPTPPAVNNQPKINTSFDPLFQNTAYDVVRYATTADRIPAYLEPFFASASASTPGWICQTGAQAETDIKHYGFLPIPICGQTR